MNQSNKCLLIVFLDNTDNIPLFFSVIILMKKKNNTLTDKTLTFINYMTRT